MITDKQLGHAFSIMIDSPGEIILDDLNTCQYYAVQILQLWGDDESLFILSERANYTFKKSKNVSRYILSRVVLIKTDKDQNTGLYLPGAEVHEWKGGY